MARVIWKRTWSLSGKWDTMDWQKSHQNWSEPADVEAGLAWPGRPWGSSRPGRPAARRGRAGWAGGEQSCALRLEKRSARCHAPGVPCERPGPAGSGEQPLPHTWRAEGSQACAAAPLSQLCSRFVFLRRSPRLPRGRARPGRRCCPAATPGGAGRNCSGRARDPGHPWCRDCGLCPAASRALGKPCCTAGPCCQNASDAGIRVCCERELLMGQRVIDKVCIALSFVAV